MYNMAGLVNQKAPVYRYTRAPIQDIDFKIQETLDVALTKPGAFAYNVYMIQTPPRLSTMRTMAGSFFVYEHRKPRQPVR